MTLPLLTPLAALAFATTAEFNNQMGLRGPENFVAVPGNPTPGLGGQQYTEGITSFCMARFEMKHPQDATGEDYWNDKEAIPSSQPAHRPWTNVTLDQARMACERINIPGFRFALINNGQWQTVARNIEATVSNWKSGKIARGHVRVSPPRTLAVDDVRNPLSGMDTIDPGEKLQERIHTLSNGETVWDLSGNASEWVMDLKEDMGIIDNSKSIPVQDLHGFEKLVFGPAGEYRGNSNLGVFWSSGTQAIVRGGSWGEAPTAGIFEGHGTLQDMPVGNGFRCVAIP